MAINFDELPDEKNKIFDGGFYTLKIEGAEMKQGKNQNNPPYLSLRYAMLQNGKTIGTMFDMIFDSDAQLPRYKLKRFVTACKLQLPTFELKDLPKIVIGKTLIGDVAVEQSEGYPPKNVIDGVSNEVFYSVDEPPLGFVDGIITIATETDTVTTNENVEY